MMYIYHIYIFFFFDNFDLNAEQCHICMYIYMFVSVYKNNWLSYFSTQAERRLDCLFFLGYPMFAHNYQYIEWKVRDFCTLSYVLLGKPLSQFGRERERTQKPRQEKERILFELCAEFVPFFVFGIHIQNRQLYMHVYILCIYIFISSHSHIMYMYI